MGADGPRAWGELYANSPPGATFGRAKAGPQRPKCGNAATVPIGSVDPGGPPANVPTLSQWGLLLTILLVAAAAALKLRRRRTAR